MSIEKIKFGDQEFGLVPAGVDLGENGGTIAFQKGRLTFDEIETLLKSGSSITLIGLSGEPDWSRSDLVYAGRLTKQSNYEIDGESTEVMIAEYRMPSLQDEIQLQETKIVSLNAQISHLATISGIGVETNTAGQTLEEKKEAKKSEINSVCGQTVCNGITVELSTGFEHFSLTQSDQLNLFGLQVQLASGAEQIVYHADGQLCRFYAAADIALLVEKAMFHVSYHVTYGNSLKTWINSVETEEELQEIFYGADVPEKYQSDVLKVYLAQIAAMASEEGAKR